MCETSARRGPVGQTGVHRWHVKQVLDMGQTDVCGWHVKRVLDMGQTYVCGWCEKKMLDMGQWARLMYVVGV